MSVRPLVSCDTFFQIILKNTKIFFLSILVFVWPFALCDIYFQVIQKYQNKYEISKYKNINIFEQTNFLRTTWSLIL